MKSFTSGLRGGLADSLDEAKAPFRAADAKFRHHCQTFNPLLVPLQRRAASEPRQALAVDTAGAL
jgi:hypothetical protein